MAVLRVPQTVCIDNGRGGSKPAEMHRSWISALRMRFGVRKNEGEEKLMDDEEREGGVKLSSLQASMLVRSKALPVGMSTRSAIGQPVIGQR